MTGGRLAEGAGETQAEKLNPKTAIEIWRFSGYK
jgi:hypothetical protein